MKEKLVKVRNEKYVSVLDNEADSKESIIFLHGLTGNKYQLQFFYEYFNKNYRCISLDFRGRGDSSSAEDNSNLDEHTKDVINLIKELNLQNIILVGYSMGGFVASMVASEIKIEKLILLDGAATMDDHQDKIVVPTFGRLENTYKSESEYINSVVKKYEGMGVLDSNKLRKAVKYEIEEDNSLWKNKAERKTIEHDWSSFHNFDIKKISATIENPTLLIQCLGSVGDLGPLFKSKNYENTKKYMKNLEVYESDTNHYSLVFNEQKEIIKIIDQFLNKEY